MSGDIDTTPDRDDTVRRARMAVAKRATSVQDRRELLAALGLLPQRRHE